MGSAGKNREAEFRRYIAQRLRVVRAQNFASLPPGSKLFFYFYRFLIALVVVGLALEVAVPVIEQDFSRQSLSQLGTILYLLVCGVPLFMACESTRLGHLSARKKAALNVVLHLGALTFLASAVLVRAELYGFALCAAIVAVIIVRYAKVHANGHHA